MPLFSQPLPMNAKSSHSDRASGDAPILPPPEQTSPARTLILHVGLHKTGTTAIQSFLRANRDRLAALGWNFPLLTFRDEVLENHSIPLFISYAKRLDECYHWLGNYWDFEKDHHSQVREKTQAELLELAHANPAQYTLLSGELFSALQEDEQRAFREFAQLYWSNIRVICYYRHPVDFSISTLSEYLKGRIATLTDSLRALPEMSQDRRIARLQRVWGDALELYGYEDEVRLHGTSYASLMHQLGVGAIYDWQVPSRREQNITPEDSSVRFMAFNHGQYAPLPDGSTNPEPMNLRFVPVTREPFALRPAEFAQVEPVIRAEIDALNQRLGLNYSVDSTGVAPAKNPVAVAVADPALYRAAALELAWNRALRAFGLAFYQQTYGMDPLQHTRIFRASVPRLIAERELPGYALTLRGQVLVLMFKVFKAFAPARRMAILRFLARWG